MRRFQNRPQLNPFIMVIWMVLFLIFSPVAVVNANHDLNFPAYFDANRHDTYLINGLASAVPSIGFGLKGLSEHLAGNYYSYITPIESTLPLQIIILNDIRKRVAADPNTHINLIGVSYGGNIATLIANQLHRSGIQVNYLGIIDAPAPVSVKSNVHRADNFLCRKIGCIGQRLRLSRDNEETLVKDFIVGSGHIGLSANQFVQQRIIGQLTELPLNVMITDFEQNEDANGIDLFGD